MMKFIGGVILALITTQALAQTQQVFYLRSDGARVDSVADADYIRVVKAPDSGSVLFNINEFYRNSKPKLIAKSSTINPLTFDGQAVTYYTNGKRESVMNYTDGVLMGSSYLFYPNGKLHASLSYDTAAAKSQEENMRIMSCADSTGKATLTDGNGRFIDYDLVAKTISEEGDVKDGRPHGEWRGTYASEKITYTDTYQDGKFISGYCVTADGKRYTYTRKSQSPEFKGGDAAFTALVKKKVKYPAALKAKSSSLVVTFVVDNNGKVTNSRLLGTVTPEVDKAVLAAVNASPLWKPGIQNGRPVNSSWILPLAFGPEQVKKPAAK